MNWHPKLTNIGSSPSFGTIVKLKGNWLHAKIPFFVKRGRVANFGLASLISATDTRIGYLLW